MITCFIRYIIDLNKINEFEKYARVWIELVEKYGGVHNGYFIPKKNSGDLSGSSFSFPDIGKNGPNNVAVAIFSFSSLEKYETYKKKVVKDKKCKDITAYFNKTKCFLSYERSFLKPISSEPKESDSGNKQRVNIITVKT
jgi:hypothetical protein